MPEELGGDDAADDGWSSSSSEDDNWQSSGDEVEAAKAVRVESRPSSRDAQTGSLDDTKVAEILTMLATRHKEILLNTHRIDLIAGCEWWQEWLTNAAAHLRQRVGNVQTRPLRVWSGFSGLWTDDPVFKASSAPI